jgi:hypothetical protein
MININNLSIKHSSGSLYQQFFIKNNSNNRTFTAKYTNDNKLYEKDIIKPSIFDQNILLLSSLNVNKTNNNDYIFCDYNFAEIINNIYITRTNHKYTENFILKKDSKNQILTLQDNLDNNFVELNSLIAIKEFYFRRTPNFTFDDFTKAIEEYKKVNVRNNTALYNYLIGNNLEDFKNNFVLLLERLRLKAILEFSIWRTKLEDYKKKTRDSRGNIINRDPINYFKLILNPFNLEELVEIGINYSDRYKDLLEDKYIVLNYNGEDYKNNKYMYSNEEFEYVEKLNNILGLGKKLELELQKLEKDYEKKLTNIDLKFKILPEKEKTLNMLNNLDEFKDLLNFKENWKSFIKLTDEKYIQSVGLNNLVYENIVENKLIIDKIREKIVILNDIGNYKDMLSEDLQKIYSNLSKTLQELLVEYEIINRYYRNLEINNKKLINNINTQLETGIKEKLSNVNILVELKDGIAKKLNLNFLENLTELLNIKIDTIKKIILPNITGESVKLFINPFTFEVKNRDTLCNISSFGNLGSIITNKNECNIETLYPIANYKRTYFDGNLIINKVITKVITKGKSRDKKTSKIQREIDMDGGSRIEREILFNLNSSDRRVEIKLENILPMIIKLNYSAYLTRKYSGDFNLSTRLELFLELNTINRFLENSNIPKIQIVIDDDEDEKIKQLEIKKVNIIRDEYIYPELQNVLRTLENHPRYLEIAFLFELYFKHSKKEYKNNWLEYLIKLNDELTDLKIFVLSELDKLNFNVKLKFSKKEFIYDNNFNNFIRNLNEYIEIKEFINNRDIINKINQLLISDQIAKYTYYQQLLRLIPNIIMNEDINIDIVNKINELLLEILEEKNEVSIEELQKIKDLLIIDNLREYNFVKEIRDLAKNIRNFNKYVDSNIFIDTDIDIYRDTMKDTDRDTRRDTRKDKGKGKVSKKSSKVSRKTALIMSLRDIDFITVFKITKNVDDRKLVYNLLWDKIEVIEEEHEEREDKEERKTISFIPRERFKPKEESDIVDVDFLQLGGDRKYLDRNFYLLRNEFYEERLKELYEKISSKLKDYKPIELPEINKFSDKRKLKDYFEKVVDYYNKLIKLYNSGIEKLRIDFKEIKDIIVNQVKDLNPYENEFNSNNFEKIKLLEYQKSSLPFEIVYIHNGLDLKNTSNEFLEKITKELINYIKSINKTAIYRTKSVEYKILNNLPYNYNLIQKELLVSQTVKLSDYIDISKIDKSRIDKSEYRQNKKRLLEILYLREDESSGLGAELEMLKSKTEESDKNIDKEVLQQVFKQLIKNINSKIEKIILEKISKNDITDIFDGIYENLYNIYLRNLRGLIEELKVFNIEKKQPDLIIIELIERNLKRLQKTISNDISNDNRNYILDNLLKIYQIEKEEGKIDQTEQKEDKEELLPITLNTDGSILPYNSSVCKNTFNIKKNQEILGFLSDKYKLMSRDKLTKISESKYKELNIVNQYQDKKYIYLVVNDGINNIPKYKQKKESKIDENINEISEEEQIEINKFILIYSLKSLNLVIPFIKLINKSGRRVMINKVLDEYVLCNRVKSPKDKNMNKLLQSNIIVLLIENFLNIKWEDKLPIYLELSKNLKDKYKNKSITTSNIQIKLLEFLNLLVDNIYNNIPDKLDDKYFLQFVLKNNIYKYNFEWLLYYYVDVMKLQLLRDNMISINMNILLSDFNRMMKNTDFENNLNNLERLVNLINKKNKIINDYNIDIINDIQRDNRIKNIKNKKKTQFIDKLKRDLDNNEGLKRILILENEINNNIDMILENYDKNISDLNRLEILINQIQDIPKIDINKENIIKQILNL